MNGDVKAIQSLYRSCLREIRRLPVAYLRQFFRLQVADDVRSALDPNLGHLHHTKVRRIQKDLRKLEGANKGHSHAFRYILDTAYGRRGQLKWEIIQPLRTDPKEQPPPPIIPSVPSSRPPVWSTEMKALVTSEISRSKVKALKHKALDLPPSIPAERFDPSSEASRIHGPFSKRREVNIRWKFFMQEVKKTHFPLQVTLVERPLSGDTVVRKTDEASVAAAGLRGIALQGSGVFEEAEALACPPALRRLEDSAAEKPSTNGQLASHPRFESHLPQRFLRRRYQALLSKTPVLTFKALGGSGTSLAGSNNTRPIAGQLGRYEVSMSPNSARRHGLVQCTMEPVDMAWAQHAWENEKGRKQGQGKKSR